MRATPLWVCGALALWLSSGCATTRYEEYGPPVDQAEASPVPPPQETVAEMERRISDLEAQLAARAADLDTASGELAERLNALAEQVVEIQRQLQALREASAGAAPSASRAVPAVRDPGGSYEQGLADFQEERYAQAKERFQEALSADPKGDLADNAQYWIGECEFALKAFPSALTAFQKVFLYPKTEKDDDAQLKLGLCYLEMGDREKALIELKRLVVDYPESEYLNRTEALIREIRGQIGSEP